MGSLSLLRKSLLNVSRRRCAVWSSPISASGLQPRYRSSSSLAVPKFPFLMFPGEETADEYKNNEEIKKKLIKFRTFSPITNEFMYPSAEVPEPEEIKNAYCAGSSRGWLLFVSRIDCRIYLADLFSSPSSSPTFVPLPPIDTLPHVNHVSCSCSKNHKRKPFEVHYRNDNIFCYHDAAMMSEKTIWKMAISSDPTDTDCTVMISCGPEGNILAYCRIGDTSWTFLESPPPTNAVTDIVYCKKDKLFYAIDIIFEVEAFDLITNPSSPRRFACPFKYDVWPLDYEIEKLEKCFDCHIYLVESPQGDILLVSRYFSKVAEDGSVVDDVGDDDIGDSYRSVRFHVFKLDFQNQTGRLVDDLEDTALFLGLNQSFSLSVRDYPQLSSNSIYFADDMFCVNFFDFRNGGGHDFGVYNHNDKSVSPLYQPFQFTKMISPPLWVYRA